MEPTAAERLAGVPVVVPLGFHCAPSIVNDVLGHDASRPRMRTPFALGVFPPASIAALLADGLSAGAMVGRGALVRDDGSPIEFADDPSSRAFGHGVLVRHARYAGVCFNHDFATDTCGAIANHAWVLGMYEAKVSHLRALLRAAPEHGVVLCTVASPLLVDGRQLADPPGRARLAADAAAALDAVRALAREERAPPGAVAGVVVLHASLPADGAEDDAERADVVLQPLRADVAEQLHGYGQMPIPQREGLYREVYTAFLHAADALQHGALRGAFPRWEHTRFAADVLAVRGPELASLRRRPCSFHRQGRCHFGQSCRFAHPEPQPSDP